MRAMIVCNNAENPVELITGLTRHGHMVATSQSLDDALGKVHNFDIVFLYPDLTHKCCFEICQRIRTQSDIPIVILGTDESDEFDRILGLRLGADDYLIWPTSIHELDARMDTVFRRIGERAPAEVLAAGGVHLYPKRRQVFVHNREIELTRKEFDLLALLLSDPGAVFTREQIMGEVWGYDGAIASQTLSVHMVGLRRKIGIKGYIETVRGIGFRIMARVTEASLGSIGFDRSPPTAL